VVGSCECGDDSSGPITEIEFIVLQEVFRVSGTVHRGAFKLIISFVLLFGSRN
jgi:hypothetical protein